MNSNLPLVFDLRRMSLRWSDAFDSMMSEYSTCRVILVVVY